MEAVEGGVESPKEVRKNEGVVQGGDGEVLVRAIRGVTSLPAASLSIFSHYPSGVLTRDFYKGRFKSSKQKRPATGTRFCLSQQSSDFLSRII